MIEDIWNAWLKWTSEFFSEEERLSSDRSKDIHYYLNGLNISITTFSMSWFLQVHDDN